MDSRLRGNDGNGRPACVNRPEVPCATAGTGSLTVARSRGSSAPRSEELHHVDLGDDPDDTCASSTTIATFSSSKTSCTFASESSSPTMPCIGFAACMTSQSAVHSPRTMLCKQVDLVDDHHRVAGVARADRHLRDAHVRHAPGHRRDGLVSAGELHLTRLELQQLAHRAEALLRAEEAHVAHPLVVVALAEIAVAGVGDDHEDDLARAETARDVERAVHRGAGGAAGEDALAPRELSRG